MRDHAPVEGFATVWAGRVVARAAPRSTTGYSTLPPRAPRPREHQREPPTTVMEGCSVSIAKRVSLRQPGVMEGKRSSLSGLVADCIELRWFCEHRDYAALAPRWRRARGVQRLWSVPVQFSSTISEQHIVRPDRGWNGWRDGRECDGVERWGRRRNYQIGARSRAGPG